MEYSNYLFAFSLTLVAGLATGLGSFVALLVKKDSTRFLAVALGLSAGVMIYVSFTELLPEAQNSLHEAFGVGFGNVVFLLSFFGGMLLIALIDKLVPDDVNPHEVLHHPSKTTKELATSGRIGRDHATLHRTGILTAMAIGIHNFPEGMATFAAALENPSLGVAIAAAIAIHNIPEGIAIAVPIYFATGSRKSAFTHSFLSGLAEPLGAIVGMTLLMPFMGPGIFGILFAMVAGIMVFISFDELLPSAEKYGAHHLSIYGLIAGMAIMAISMMLLMHEH